MKRRTKKANWRTIRSKDQKVFAGKHDSASTLYDPLKLMQRAAKKGRKTK